MAPSTFDPASENETPLPLPSAPPVIISENTVLQPSLSRRGTGPGVVLFLPAPDRVPQSTKPKNILDPEPTTKWAEEGYAVVSITGAAPASVGQNLKEAFDTLQSLDAVDVKDKFAVIVYEPQLIFQISDAASKDPRAAAFIGYGSFASPALTIPIVLHLTANAPRPANPPSVSTKVYTYNSTSAFFVLPQSSKYDSSAAAQAHSRTLAFIRKTLGGPIFDLGALWDEHTTYEFELRSVAKTLSTMVAEPYVHHVPTLTGGIGRESLTAFYRDHFIFANPEDTSLEPISRTVGVDRVVDEFIAHVTHDRVIDWLLPGVPPTGKKLRIPTVAIVTFRGDRLSTEHIHWDQATVLRQAGLLPTHHPLAGSASVHLPVAGAESAGSLLDPLSHPSNEMMRPDWVDAQSQ